MIQISMKDAVQIVDGIKRGTPPPVRLIHHLHVGRQRWLEGMAWYLDAAKDHDLSAVRFIIGEYGNGKTHFLRMTAHMALERRFVVCEVTLSPDGRVRLDRFDIIWQEMMSNLATPESDGEREGIEAILNRWCERVAQSPEQLQRALVELERIPKLDPDFRQALRGYLRAWLEEGDRDSYLQWFKGDPIKPKGVRVRIDRTNARAMLRSLVQFFKHLGYRGLVLFLDELELIMRQRRRMRDASYEILRQFIDDTDNLSNFLLLCSATPQMRSDDQMGFPSYPALQQRLGGMLGEVRGDYRAIMVNLGEADLSDDDLLELVRRLRAIHNVAYDWHAEQAVPDEFLPQLVHATKQQKGEFPLIRTLVETTISLLEAKQQNPERDLEDLLSDALRDAMERIRQQERDRYRPWE